LHSTLDQSYADFVQGQLDCLQGNYKDCEAMLNQRVSEVKGEVTGQLADDIYWFLGLAAAHNGRADHRSRPVAK
jgi:hypothetical protein